MYCCHQRKTKVSDQFFTLSTVEGASCNNKIQGTKDLNALCWLKKKCSSRIRYFLLHCTANHCSKIFSFH
jgi:hypothetical protein